MEFQTDKISNGSAEEEPLRTDEILEDSRIPEKRISKDRQNSRGSGIVEKDTLWRKKTVKDRLGTAERG